MKIISLIPFIEAIKRLIIKNRKDTATNVCKNLFFVVVFNIAKYEAAMIAIQKIKQTAAQNIGIYVLIADI